MLLTDDETKALVEVKTEPMDEVISDAYMEDGDSSGEQNGMHLYANIGALYITSPF